MCKVDTDINISINLTQSDLEKIDSLIGEHGITDIKIEQIETTTYLIIQLDSLSYVLDIPVRVNKKHHVVKAKFTHKQDLLFILKLNGYSSNALVVSTEFPSFNRITTRRGILHPNIDYFTSFEDYNDVVDSLELSNAEVDILHDYFDDYFIDDLYYSKMCLGSLVERAHIIKYIDLYIKEFLYALYYPNFDSPYVSIENYIHAFSDPDLPQTVLERVDTDVPRKKHNYNKECKCMGCTILSYASGYLTSSLSDIFTVSPFTEFEFEVKNLKLEGVEIEVGFNVNRLETFSRFCNLVNIERLSVRKAFIIGLGNLGSRIAIDIRRLPIFDISLMDYDRINIENVFTQQYNSSDVGCMKSSCLSDDLYRIRTFDRYITHQYPINTKFFFDYNEPIPEDYQTEHFITINMYKENSMKNLNRNLIIVAVDSQEARKHIINFYEHFSPPTYEYEGEYLRPLFIDVSMSKNFVRVFSFYLDNQEAIRRYKVLLDQKVTEEPVCGETSHNWMGTLTSYIVQKILLDEAEGKEIPFYTHITPDLSKVSYSVKDDFFPRYIAHIRDFLDINTYNPFDSLSILSTDKNLIGEECIDGIYPSKSTILRYIPFEILRDDYFYNLPIRHKFGLARGNRDYFTPLFLFPLCEKLKDGIAVSDYCKNQCPLSRFRFLCKDRDTCLLNNFIINKEPISAYIIGTWLGKVEGKEYSRTFIDLINSLLIIYTKKQKLDDFFLYSNDHYKVFNEYFKHLNREEYENDNFY